MAPLHKLTALVHAVSTKGSGINYCIQGFPMTAVDCWHGLSQAC